MSEAPNTLRRKRSLSYTPRIDEKTNFIAQKKIIEPKKRTKRGSVGGSVGGRVGGSFLGNLFSKSPLKSPSSSKSPPGIETMEISTIAPPDMKLSFENEFEKKFFSLYLEENLAENYFKYLEKFKKFQKEKDEEKKKKIQAELYNNYILREGNNTLNLDIYEIKKVEKYLLEGNPKGISIIAHTVKTFHFKKKRLKCHSYRFMTTLKLQIIKKLTKKKSELKR
jgi:hypothetical protein